MVFFRVVRSKTKPIIPPIIIMINTRFQLRSRMFLASMNRRITDFGEIWSGGTTGFTEFVEFIRNVRSASYRIRVITRIVVSSVRIDLPHAGQRKSLSDAIVTTC